MENIKTKLNKMEANEHEKRKEGITEEIQIGR